MSFFKGRHSISRFWGQKPTFFKGQWGKKIYKDCQNGLFFRHFRPFSVAFWGHFWPFLAIFWLNFGQKTSLSPSNWRLFEGERLVFWAIFGPFWGHFFEGGSQIWGVSLGCFSLFLGESALFVRERLVLGASYLRDRGGFGVFGQNQPLSLKLVLHLRERRPFWSKRPFFGKKAFSSSNGVDI